MNEYSNDLSDEKKYFPIKIKTDENEVKINNNNTQTKKNSFEPLLLPNSVHLLTYNFFSRPPPIHTNGTDYKDARLKDFLEFMPDFDIICPPSFFSKYVVDSGLLILSKYEIIENDTYDYFLNISGDCPTKKGILYAKIKLRDRYLFLFNTHLQSSYFDESQSNINCTIQVRTAQTEELINFVYNKLLTIPKEQVKKGCVLIVGDFNIDAHDNKFVRERYTIPKYNITEYELLLKKLSKLGKAIDIMDKKYNDHLFTFGNNDKPEYDQVLTAKAEINLKQTLDYMWEIIPDYNLDIYNNSFCKMNTKEIKEKIEDEDDNDKIKVLYGTFKTQEFLVKNRPYQQLSDHFGISVELSLPSLNNNLSDSSSLNVEVVNVK